MPRLNNCPKGFTLIELLIVITIIISITVAVVPSFAGYIRSQGVKQASEQVKSDLRSVQNKALTGALSDEIINFAPVAYWAVRFSNSARYEYFISDVATSCPNSFTTGQLQGYADLPTGIEVKSSGYKCIFFSMANGSVSTINFGANILIVGYEGSLGDGDCRRIQFNTGGLIYTGVSQVCT